jgi:hypothetical protein
VKERGPKKTAGLAGGLKEIWFDPGGASSFLFRRRRLRTKSFQRKIEPNSWI